MTAAERRGTLLLLRLATRLTTFLAGWVSEGEEVAEEGAENTSSTAPSLVESSRTGEAGTGTAWEAEWWSCCLANEVLVGGTKTAIEVRRDFKGSPLPGVSGPFVSLFSLSGRTTQGRLDFYVRVRGGTNPWPNVADLLALAPSLSLSFLWSPWQDKAPR